ncbi:hypothetical protein SAMN05443550_102363 [Pedobacter hartonius]|uniref:Uncharacterized protein n=1 Tax=Pedobacter hartonius TaxID=425514 RepID=A0A1H3ZH74_9SPHI|nr:hypothetical protein SAMN05443550_102363 [Pedobacter hartonius]
MIITILNKKREAIFIASLKGDQYIKLLIEAEGVIPVRAYS